MFDHYAPALLIAHVATGMVCPGSLLGGVGSNPQTLLKPESREEKKKDEEKKTLRRDRERRRKGEEI